MIKVLLFAQLQEESGQHELTIERSNITVSELKEQLTNEFALPSIESAMVAINEEFANEQVTVKAGDTVAFIPPVSGG